MCHKKQSLLMSLNQTSPHNTQATRKVVSCAATNTGNPSGASMPFPPNRNPSMQGASAFEVPNHLPRTSPNPPAAGSPTAHARTSTSASALHTHRSNPLHSTTAFAASSTSASASFVNTGDSKHNPSGKSHTSPRSAPLFGEETHTHTHRSNPLPSTSSTHTTTHRNQTSQATIGGRMGASSGPESKKEAVGSLQTANDAEGWTTVQSKARTPTSKVAVFALNGKNYEFELDPKNHDNILAPVRLPNGKIVKQSTCSRNFEECVLNPDFRVPQASCKSEHDHGRPFCKNFHTGRKCSANCAKRAHLVLPSPSAESPSGASGEVIVVPSAAPKVVTKTTNAKPVTPTMTLTLGDKTYTFPLENNKVGVEVKMPSGTRTVWVCANWFDKTVFNTDCRAPRTDCCGGNHGRIFCKNVFTGRECSKACQSFYHMVLPQGTPLPPKVVAAQSVPSAAAFPALASDKTLKEQGAACAVIREKMKVTPRAKPAKAHEAANATSADEPKANHIDKTKEKTKVCKYVIAGTPDKCPYFTGQIIDSRGRPVKCAFSHDLTKVRAGDAEYRAEFDKNLSASKIDFQGIFAEVAHVMTENAASIRLLDSNFVDDKDAKRHIHLLTEKRDIVERLAADTIEPRHFEDLVLLWSACACIARANNIADEFVLFNDKNGPKENEVWELARRLSTCKTSFDFACKVAHYRPVAAEVTARADREYAKKYSDFWLVSVKRGCTSGCFCKKGAHYDLETTECTNHLDLDILSGKKSAPVPECTVLALPRDVPPRSFCQAPQAGADEVAANAATELEEKRTTYIETLLAFLDVKKQFDSLNDAPVEETQRRKLQSKCDSKRKELENARDDLQKKTDQKAFLASSKIARDALVARLKADTRAALQAEELRLQSITQLTKQNESEFESEPESSEGDNDICFEESSEEESEDESESELDGDAIIAKHFKTAPETDISGQLKKDLKACTERCDTLREAVARFVDPAFPTLKLSVAKRFPTASEKDRKQLSYLEDSILRYDEKIAIFNAEIALANAKCTELEVSITELHEQHKAAVANAIAATNALSACADTTDHTIRFRDLSTECIRLEAELYTLSREMDALNKVVFRNKSKGICPVTSFFYEPLKPLPRKETQLVAQTFDTDFFAPSGVVALKPALTDFGAAAAIVPLQAIEYPNTQSTDKAPVAPQSVKPRKERTCEEDEEDTTQEWCGVCKGVGCILCTSNSQDQIAFGNFGTCRFYPCERSRKAEMETLERARKSGAKPVCKLFECPESDCPYRAHRLKIAKKNETALALLAVRPAPKAPKPKLLAIESVDFDACPQVAAGVEIAEVVVDDKLSLAAFITHSSEPTHKRLRKGEKKGLAVKPNAKPEAKPEAKPKVNFWDAIDEDEGIPVDINVSHHKDKSTTTISFPEGVPSLEKIVYLAKIVGVVCTKGEPHIDQFLEVLSALARKMRKLFSTNCTIDKDERQLSLRGSLATKISEYLKKIDFADTVDSTVPVRTTTKAQASARGANQKAGKSRDTRDSGEHVLQGKK